MAIQGSGNDRARTNGAAHSGGGAAPTPAKSKTRTFDFDMSESDDENYEPDLRGNKPKSSRQNHNLTNLYKRNSAGNRVPWGSVFPRTNHLFFEFLGHRVRPSSHRGVFQY
eukprot:3934749-Rhodomonas_salina.2